MHVKRGKPPGLYYVVRNVVLLCSFTLW